MKAPQLRHGAATDVGLVRSVNEDSHLVRPPVFVVADGMGGHRGGAVASSIVTDEFSRVEVAGLDARAGAELLVATLTRCQTRIRGWGDTQPDPTRWRAGTTVAVALAVHEAEGHRWLLANLGDSRIYRVRHGALEQVSVDHSVVQELLDAGRITAGEALVHPERHVITKALGSPAGVNPDFFLLPLSAGDRLVLCTDGVSGLVGDAGMQEILSGCGDPQAAAEALVAAALRAGGRDNATAVVVDVVGWTTDDAYDAVPAGTGPETKWGAPP